MAGNSWMDDPILSEISPQKKELITKIIEGSKGREPKEMLTYFIKESNMASKNGMNFTDEETNLILNVLKEDMSPQDIKKIDTIRKMVAKISKKGL